MNTEFYSNLLQQGKVIYYSVVNSINIFKIKTYLFEKYFNVSLNISRAAKYQKIMHLMYCVDL